MARRLSGADVAVLLLWAFSALPPTFSRHHIPEKDDAGRPAHAPTAPPSIAASPFSLPYEASTPDMSMLFEALPPSIDERDVENLWGDHPWPPASAPSSLGGVDPGGLLSEVTAAVPSPLSSEIQGLLSKATGGAPSSQLLHSPVDASVVAGLLADPEVGGLISQAASGAGSPASSVDVKGLIAQAEAASSPAAGPSVDVKGLIAQAEAASSPAAAGSSVDVKGLIAQAAAASSPAGSSGDVQGLISQVAGGAPSPAAKSAALSAIAGNLLDDKNVGSLLSGAMGANSSTTERKPTSEVPQETSGGSVVRAPSLFVAVLVGYFIF